ncbi:MAG TPA: chromate efflux transporter [Luteimonas sp.]|nr:chromate efflux transporter [Luteimonas sp.]
MTNNVESSQVPERISLPDATRVWARIGWLSFGGPAGQIALMHRELVEKRRWISESRFLHALNYCMLLPGPEAQQLAVYIGWLMHRTRGGLIAGGLFVVPGILTILLLSVLYAKLGHVPIISAIFFGLKAAVLAVVVEAVLRIGRRALKNRLMVGIAIAAFVAIFAFKVPFPLIILGAALLGILGRWLRPAYFPDPTATEAEDDAHYLIDHALAKGELTHTRPSKRRALVVLIVSLCLWFLPVLAVIAWLGRDSVLAQQGLFFSQTAMVTFGGAYAVLAYVAQRAVEGYGWLTPGQMLDGLALAETTPGPLIMVVQFVAFQAAYQHQVGLSPLLAGVLGSLLTTWVTFVPCFLWIFLGAPYIEALRHNRALHSALSAITAAVVGVILNLSVWFTLHTVFHQVEVHDIGWLQLDVPIWGSFDPAAFALGAMALIAMLRFKLAMGWTLLGSAVLGALWTLLHG